MRRAALCAAALAVSGCCNVDIICNSVVNVRFSRAAALPYRIEARTLRDSLLVAVDCTGDNQCSATNVSLPGVRDEQFVVRVTEIGTYVSVATVQPFYERPSACASCLTGNVTVPLGTH